MTVGHIATSYLIVFSAQRLGIQLSIPEQLLIISFGSILDVDMVFAKFFVKNAGYHHFLPTHTPLFALILTSLLWFLLGNNISFIATLLCLFTALAHLAFDDLNHILVRLNLQKPHPITTAPQIFWLYPIDPRRNYYFRKIHRSTNYSFPQLLSMYYNHSQLALTIEICLILLAFFLIIYVK